jgi:hypothetical protein
MVKALFDTNILVDYLHAVPQARTELQRYTETSRATARLFRATTPASARRTGFERVQVTLNDDFHCCRHSGARAPAREPGIYNHDWGLWIPGSRKGAPRNDAEDVRLDIDLPTRPRREEGDHKGRPYAIDMV